jgi:hypothetical protein
MNGPRHAAGGMKVPGIRKVAGSGVYNLRRGQFRQLPVDLSQLAVQVSEFRAKFGLQRGNSPLLPLFFGFLDIKIQLPASAGGA